MKVITTVTVEIERTDGSYTRKTERREHDCGDNPSLEATEVANALAVTISRLNARIEDGSVG